MRAFFEGVRLQCVRFQITYVSQLRTLLVCVYFGALFLSTRLSIGCTFPYRTVSTSQPRYHSYDRIQSSKCQITLTLDSFCWAFTLCTSAHRCPNIIPIHDLDWQPWQLHDAADYILILDAVCTRTFEEGTQWPETGQEPIGKEWIGTGGDIERIWNFWIWKRVSLARSALCAIDWYHTAIAVCLHHWLLELLCTFKMYTVECAHLWLVLETYIL